MGRSYKKYANFFSLVNLRSLLLENNSILSTKNSLCLSGTGWLQNLCIRWEAVTQTDFKKKIKGFPLCYYWARSPFGETLIMESNRVVYGISFSSELGKNELLKDMRERWSGAKFTPVNNNLFKIGEQIFKGRGTVKMRLIGTPFQISVWCALTQIPFGHVSTYSNIARAIGQPKAARAVGSAIGKNPIGWLIPCHRAVKKNGALGGYHWGLPIKRQMLAFEALQKHKNTNH